MPSFFGKCLQHAHAVFLHPAPFPEKVAKCVFTRGTRPAQLQLSPNLLRPSFSGLSGKYRFSCSSRHIIYLIKCVFWHVRYLPDGLASTKEQVLPVVQTAALLMAGRPPVLFWFFFSFFFEWVLLCSKARIYMAHLPWGASCFPMGTGDAGCLPGEARLSFKH